MRLQKPSGINSIRERRSNLLNFMSSRGFKINFVLFIINTLSFIACSFSTLKPSWSSGKKLAANAGGRGFKSHLGQTLFLQFTLFYRVKCEKLFCKNNIKLKVLKI